MPFYCCVPLCKQRGVKDASGNKVSFFAFPSDPVIRKQWIIAIRRDEGEYFTITKYTKICSKHFLQSDFLPNVAGNRRFLKQQAVPSVFTFEAGKCTPRKNSRRQVLLAAPRLPIAADDLARGPPDDLISEDPSFYVECTVNEDGNIHAAVDKASDESSYRTVARGLASSTVSCRLQELQEQTESQARVIQDLELELHRHKEQLRGAEHAMSKAHSDLEHALSKCERFDGQAKGLAEMKQALFRAQTELESALARCSA
ncbi:unnamed protein product, partial [Ixodes hexagonus]